MLLLLNFSMSSFVMVNLASAKRRFSVSSGSEPVALKTPFPSLKINYNAVHKKRNGVGAVYYETAGELNPFARAFP